MKITLSCFLGIWDKQERVLDLVGVEGALVWTQYMH